MLLDNYDTKRTLMNEQSDEAVLTCSFKDPRAFAELVERYTDAFQRKAFSILHNKEAAEDAVQDAFVKVYKNARRFKPEPGAGFKSWAYRILVNTCFTVYQKRKREGIYLAQLDPEFQELVADKKELVSAEERLNTDEVASFLQELPESLAQVMRLHFVEGKPHAVVAQIVGISEGAVRARVHRAKQELRDLIAARRSKNPHA